MNWVGRHQPKIIIMNSIQKAIAAPLLGLFLCWVFFLLASGSDLLFQPDYDLAAMTELAPELRPSKFLYLAGIALLAQGSLTGLRKVDAFRNGQKKPGGLTLASLRLNVFSVIISLASGTIYALVNFFGAFGGLDSEGGIIQRIFGVYLPILLATVLVVYVMLAAFVWRTARDDDQKRLEKFADPRRRALALGYALPIIAGASAVIFGLVVYDITGTSLESWVWVIIQAIVASGIILGTRFARRAKYTKAVVRKDKNRLAGGAWNLNFVLSVIFGTVVSIMAFVFGTSSFEKLKSYNFDYAGWEIAPISFNWILGDFTPSLALILLAVLGVYAIITERHRDEI